MKDFLREAAGWGSEAFETACGWALYVAIAYAVFFVDATGRGNLWSNLVSIWREGKPAPVVADPAGVRVIKLGAPSETRDDSVDLVGLDYNYVSSGRAEQKAVVAINERRATALLDVPAEPAAAPRQDWKRGLKGELRRFTVYGNGEQTSSAASGPAAVKAARKQEVASYAAAAPQSAYRAGAEAPSRPAIGGRARPLGPSGSDGVRNFR